MKIVKRRLNYHIAYLKIRPTLNNIFITLTDIAGNVLLIRNSGILRFKGTKKRTPYIAGLVLKDLIFTMRKLNFTIKQFIVQVYGFLKNRSFKTVIKQLYALGIKNIFYLEYIISRTHNGIRKKKKRRL